MPNRQQRSAARKPVQKRIERAAALAEKFERARLSGARKLLGAPNEVRPMKQLFLLATLFATAAIAAASPDDATVRLSGVRSLRCVFTDANNTHFRDGQRTTETESENSKIQFDNINPAAGTARAIANNGATDVPVRLGRDGQLTFFDWSPSGNIFVTTVFPMYAKGTKEFLALSSTHYVTGVLILGQQESGMCSVSQ
jgi:hypothetical protein